MAMIDDETKAQVRERLNGMHGNVGLVLFTSKKNCHYCQQQKELVEELVSLSDRIKTEYYDIDENNGKAREYGVDKVPALILKGKERGVIRFFGLCAGYEFATLLTDIIEASNGTTGLSPAILEKLKAVKHPVHLEVFVTPQCPYCPGAVKMAHDFAMANPNIKADMVEASEFPELADRHGVRSVPTTVINGRNIFVGGQPADVLLQKILDAGNSSYKP